MNTHLNLSSTSPAGTRGILVTDFDGTITSCDFFELVRARWPLDPDPWHQALAGELPLREALRRIFGAARGTVQEFEALYDHTGVGPETGQAFRALQAAGWRIVVASAGCDYYIHRILGRVGVQVEVMAHRSRFIEGEGLIMEPLENSPLAHPHFGLNKAAVVRQFLDTGLPVAFAGDGTPDIDPLLLLPPDLRFATGWAAEELTRRGAAFQPFVRWPDLVDPLLKFT